jgi:hypothetical protein
MMKPLSIELYPTGSDFSSIILGTKGTLTYPPANSVNLIARQKTVAIDDTPTNIVTLDVEVPSLTNNGKSKLQIHQEFRVGTNATLEAVKSNSAKGALLHPRITLKPKPGPGNFPDVLVDTRFIDVTEALRSQYPNKLGGKGGYDTPWPQDSEPNKNDPHYGCRLFILEMTVGKPKAWAVIVPEAARRDRAPVNVLLFFQPAMQVTYQGTLDCYYANPSLQRYSKDPPTWAPFFVADLGFDKAAQRQDYNFRKFPETGFEGQLTKSGKPLVMVIPFPHTEGAHGEIINYGKAVEASLGELLDSLLRVIWDDKDIAKTASPDRIPPGVGRVGVAGYSYGGVPTIKAVRNNPSLVSELYLFDSTEPLTGNTLSFLKKWFKEGTSSRRLRLTGALFLEQFLQAREEILKASGKPGRGGDITVTPKDASFYDTPGNIYHAALSAPGAKNLEVLTPLQDQPTTKAGLSFESNVWLKSKTPKVVLACPTGKNTIEKEVKCTAVEAAALIKLEWLLVRGFGRIEDEIGFESLLEIIQPSRQFSDGLGVKHQWAVDGGNGNKARWPYGVVDPAKPDAVFEGYLLFCLKDSGFQ